MNQKKPEKRFSRALLSRYFLLIGIVFAFCTAGIFLFSENFNQSHLLAAVTKPVDVNYHPSSHQAYLEEWGDFSETTSVGSLAQKVITFFMYILGGVSLLAFMIAGTIIMFGGADETLLERGKSILKYSSVGIAIVLLSVLITTLVQTVFYSVNS
jgi:hypothetical protein